MKITIYELLGMIKDGKAGDITTNFMFERKEYNLLAFLDEYTLDINSLNWEVEIIEENKIPEKLIPTSLKGIDNLDEKIDVAHIDTISAIETINEIIDYLKEKENK